MSLRDDRDSKEAEEAIRKHLAERLVRYKIPKYIVIHDALPANGTGKVNDKALLCWMKQHLQ